MADEIREMLQEYRDGRISRREFIHKAVVLTGSLMVATSLTDALIPEPADGAQVDPNDASLISAEVKYASIDGTPVGAYISRPKEEGKRPAVIVIHDAGALDDHNRDIGRKLAKAGYVAIVPDLLSRQGGTDAFADRRAASQSLSKVDGESLVKDLMGAVNYVKGQSFVQANKIGVVGFCWGGGKTFLFTTRSKDVGASVIYYGPIPDNLDGVKDIAAPVLGHYGELDKRITSQVPRLAEEMKKHNKPFEYKIYADAPHAFNADNRPDRYRPAAAKEAWAKTLDFFKEHLQG